MFRVCLNSYLVKNPAYAMPSEMAGSLLYMLFRRPMEYSPFITISFIG